MCESGTSSVGVGGVGWSLGLIEVCGSVTRTASHGVSQASSANAQVCAHHVACDGFHLVKRTHAFVLGT